MWCSQGVHKTIQKNNKVMLSGFIRQIKKTNSLDIDLKRNEKVCIYKGIQSIIKGFSLYRM